MKKLIDKLLNFNKKQSKTDEHYISKIKIETYDLNNKCSRIIYSYDKNDMNYTTFNRIVDKYFMKN